MRAYPLQPGVPAAGHVTAGGFWHPGAIDTCTKCEVRPTLPPGNHAMRVRYHHSIEALDGWRYRMRLGTEPPEGEGWELNVDAGDAGHGLSKWADGSEHEVTYWRRRLPW